jgi:hypothetical protein
MKSGRSLPIYLLLLLYIFIIGTSAAVLIASQGEHVAAENVAVAAGP